MPGAGRHRLARIEAPPRAASGRRRRLPFRFFKTPPSRLCWPPAGRSLAPPGPKRRNDADPLDPPLPGQCAAADPHGAGRRVRDRPRPGKRLGAVRSGPRRVAAALPDRLSSGPYEIEVRITAEQSATAATPFVLDPFAAPGEPFPAPPAPPAEAPLGSGQH